MKYFLSLILLVSITTCHSQNFFHNDTSFNAKRTAWVSGSIAAGWIGSTIALQNVWYKENWTNEFHFFDDSKQWLGMDKVGHFYTGNMITKNVSALYRWSGFSRNNSLLIGSSVSLGYMTTIEILDGYSDQWGFSWSDMAANSFGIIWNVWQDLVWQEERLILKFSSHPSPYAQYRPEVLGEKFHERILKDYNGQTYWLTISPGSFLNDNSKFPKWLGISFGYSVDQKIHGDLNTYTTDFYGSDVTLRARSKYLLSLDIDFEKIPTNKKWLKSIFKAVNHVKIPFPTMIVIGKKVSFHPFYT